MNKRLMRSNTDKVLTGVCGGLAEYTGMDAAIVRLIVAALVLFTGVGPVAYIVAALVIPRADGRALAEDLGDKAGDWYKQQQAKQQGPAGTNGVHNPDDLR